VGTIEDAIRRLDRALRANGLPRLRKPGRDVRATIDAIHAEIDPLRLPYEVEAFWRRVDPDSLAVAPFPRPVTAAFALDTHRMHHRDTPGFAPRLLFPVCYASHVFLLAECDDGSGHDGALFERAYDDDTFHLRHAGLGAWLDLFATMLELGEVRNGVFDPDRQWEGAAAVRLAAALPLPRHGAARTVDADPRLWPAHWLGSSGLTPAATAARGASTTVAELVRGAGPGREVAGTIRARVLRLVGSGEGTRVLVSDGTGDLDLWCPAAVTTYGPVIEEEFEFDVVVRGAVAPPPDVDGIHGDVVSAAMSGDLAAAQEAAMSLSRAAFGSRPAAEATAIRPV
jgi:hypothetical protein